MRSDDILEHEIATWNMILAPGQSALIFSYLVLRVRKFAGMFQQISVPEHAEEYLKETKDARRAS